MKLGGRKIWAIVKGSNCEWMGWLICRRKGVLCNPGLNVLEIYIVCIFLVSMKSVDSVIRARFIILIMYGLCVNILLSAMAEVCRRCLLTRRRWKQLTVTTNGKQ